MKRSNLAELLLGFGSLVLGTEVVLLWDLIYILGGVGLLVLGITLILDSKESLKKSLKEKFPFRVENLFRFPRLPYFQISLLVFFFFGSIFAILPSSYQGFILVLIGLGASQSALTISKKNIKSEFRILTVLKFQVFVFFSTFIYTNFEMFYLLGQWSAYLSPIFLFVAWLSEFLYLYFKILK